MEPLRVGLVGLGVISRFYVAALTQPDSGMRLAAVCDRDETALVPFRGRTPCYRDYRAMVERDELDAVVLTLPNDAHAAACHACIDAGLAVCVEKPLALSLAEGAAIVARAGERHVMVFTAFHRRYNTAVLELVRRLPADVPIASVAVRYWERIEDHVGRDRWYLDAERCGGGCVADNGPNAYDLAALFLGELRLVDAVIERDAAGTDRRAVLTLTAGAAAARLDLDWSYPGERKDVQITLADGRTYRADMLAGFPGFKASLWHEYVGVLRAFRERMGPSRGVVDGGLPALAAVEAAYRAGAAEAGTRRAAAP
ncbi:MAG TPA: Gfo/Idh/MocA family oxidoreductase [Solirubrobacteraceae bacterium]|nr:Gfo/Idh/MocA family oxidoreductase [Solirubrobacteraceae bacterium]